MRDALVERIGAQRRRSVLEVRVPRQRLVGLVLVVDADGQRHPDEGCDLGGEVERDLAARRAQRGPALLAEEVERLRELLGGAVVDEAAAELDLRDGLDAAGQVHAVRATVHGDDAEPPRPVTRPEDVAAEGDVEPRADTPADAVRPAAVAREQGWRPGGLQVRLPRAVAVGRAPRAAEIDHRPVRDDRETFQSGERRRVHVRRGGVLLPCHGRARQREIARVGVGNGVSAGERRGRDQESSGDEQISQGRFHHRSSSGGCTVVGASRKLAASSLAAADSARWFAASPAAAP